MTHFRSLASFLALTVAGSALATAQSTTDTQPTNTNVMVGDGINTPVKITGPKVNVGETIRTTIVTTAEGGTFSANEGDQKSTGTINLHRVREIDQTIKSLDKFGRITAFSMVVNRDVTLTEVTLNGEISKNSAKSPLTGIRMVSVGDQGQWSLVPAQGTFTDEQMVAVVPLIGFENQHWKPQTPIKVGDQWNYDPAYFRHLIGQDLGPSIFSEGTMVFKEVREGSHGERLALITMNTKTLGSDDSGTSRKASIKGEGALIINLGNMLDRTSSISGELIAGASDGSQKGAAKLPFKIDMKREILPAKK